jgi:hypothetical protein
MSIPRPGELRTSSSGCSLTGRRKPWIEQQGGPGPRPDRPSANAGDRLVITVKRYIGKKETVGDDGPREATGWVLFTLASLVCFYLHYTFVVEIAAPQARGQTD